MRRPSSTLRVHNPTPRGLDPPEAQRLATDHPFRSYKDYILSPLISKRADLHLVVERYPSAEPVGASLLISHSRFPRIFETIPIPVSPRCQ